MGVSTDEPGWGFTHTHHFVAETSTNLLKKKGQLLSNSGMYGKGVKHTICKKSKFLSVISNLSENWTRLNNQIQQMSDSINKNRGQIQ